MNKSTGGKLSKHDIRINNILNLLDKHKFLSIKDISDILDVSTMTIRRDCEELSEKNLVKRKNGILYLSESEEIVPLKKAYNLKKVSSSLNNAKSAIGKYAASLIKENDTVIIDAGTTTEMIIPNIEDISINLLCTNLNILNQAVERPKFNVMFSGGNYHPNMQLFECSQAMEFISTVRANKVFISAAGVHDKLGLTCLSYEVAVVKQALMASAEQHILVSDSSKFGKVHPAFFSDLSEIDMIITDYGLSEEWKNRITEAGIELHIV